MKSPIHYSTSGVALVMISLHKEPQLSSLSFHKQPQPIMSFHEDLQLSHHFMGSPSRHHFMRTPSCHITSWGATLHEEPQSSYHIMRNPSCHIITSGSCHVTSWDSNLQVLTRNLGRTLCGKPGCKQTSSDQNPQLHFVQDLIPRLSSGGGEEPKENLCTRLGKSI